MERKNTKIIVAVSAKGGIGKSQNQFQLNGYLHYVNPKYKTLLIDCDEQRDLTLLYENGKNREDLKKSSIYRAYVHDAHEAQSPFPKDFKPAHVDTHVDLMAGDKRLANVGKIMNANNPSFGLFVIFHTLRTLKLLKGVYDYILIDTHNSLSLLPTLDSLMVADDVLVPITPSLFGVHAISDLLSSIKELKKKCITPTGQSYLNFNLYYIGNMLKTGTNSSRKFKKFAEKNPQFIAIFHNREIFQRSINYKLNIFKLVQYELDHKIHRGYGDRKLVQDKLEPQYKNIFNTIKEK